jgi:hypothetical protein
VSNDGGAVIVPVSIGGVTGATGATADDDGGAEATGAVVSNDACNVLSIGGTVVRTSGTTGATG